MRIPWITAIIVSSSVLVNALPAARPASETTYEIGELMMEMFDGQFNPPDTDLFSSLLMKRDTTSTIENLLDLLNSSDILFDVLDQIAYNPSRILMLANYTAGTLGGINFGSVSNTTSGLNIKLDINASAIYNEVMDSGVVTSLLDGILLDSSYRPVLASIISRVLQGNKNLINYLIKNVFRHLKRDQNISKRDDGGSLETFVGNVISSVLSSQLVGDLASDVLVALNETQFLTASTKRLISNEGYQNMTAQFVLDMLQSGSIKLNSQSINITSIADKVLSKPQVVVTLVSNLLSGRILLPALGKYNSAVSAIMKEVENDGTFADLNKYVFSESHSVTTPLLPTNQIVVPRTTLIPISTTSHAGKNNTSSRQTSSPSSKISTVSKLLFSFASTTKTSANGGSARTTKSTVSTDTSDSQSAAEVASILSVLQGMDTSSTKAESTETASVFIVTQTKDQTVTSSIGTDGLLSLIQTLGESSSTSKVKRAIATETSSANGAGFVVPNTIMTRMLVFMQAVLLGGLMLL